MTTDTTQISSSPASTEPQLCRPANGRVLGGVAAGLAGYFGVDVAVVRIALIALTLLGGAGVPLYAAGWLVMPDEITRRSVISEMLRPSPDSEVVG